MGESESIDSSTDPQRLLESLRLTILLTAALDALPSKRSTVVAPLNEVRDAYSCLRSSWPLGPRAKILEEAGHLPFLDEIQQRHLELLQAVVEQAVELSGALTQRTSGNAILHEAFKDLARLWQYLGALFRLAADGTPHHTVLQPEGSENFQIDQIGQLVSALQQKVGHLLLPPDLWAYLARSSDDRKVGVTLEQLVTVIDSRWRPRPKAQQALEMRAEANEQTIKEARADALLACLFQDPDNLTKPISRRSTTDDAQPGGDEAFSRWLDVFASRVSKAAERELGRESYSRSSVLESKAVLNLMMDRELAADERADDLETKLLKLIDKADLGIGEEVIRLALDGKTIPEIAKALGITENNAQVRHSRALKKLKAVARKSEM